MAPGAITADPTSTEMFYFMCSRCSQDHPASKFFIFMGIVCCGLRNSPSIEDINGDKPNFEWSSDGKLNDDSFCQTKFGAYLAAKEMFRRNAGVQFDDNYETQRTVGHGSFGRVVECTHKASPLCSIFLSISASCFFSGMQNCDTISFRAFDQYNKIISSRYCIKYYKGSYPEMSPPPWKVY